MSKRLVHTSVIGLWLLVVVICFLYSGLRLNAGNAFDSNLLGLLPNTHKNDNVWQPQVLENGGLQKQFVVLLSHPDPRQGQILAAELHRQLGAVPIVHLGGGDDIFRQLKDYYHPYRHQLLTPEKRRQLEETDSKTLAQQVVEELYSPVRPLRSYDLADDPFNLGGAWLQALFPQAARFSPGDIPSLREEDATWYVLTAKLDGSPFDPAIQQQINPLVTAFRQEHKEAQILVSGLVFHAAAGTALARKEISTVGVGSILGILLLVIRVFRSIPALLAITFTLVSSLVVALAVSLAIFGQVHLITLAFGSTLLGLAVDYCFHFLLNYRRSRNGPATGRLMVRGLILSVGSSVLAYAIQLFSPFPGLQQFAVFVAAGLMAAGAAVGVLAFCYRESLPPETMAGNRLFNRVFNPFYRRITQYPILIICVIIILLLALALVSFKVGFKDDLRLLNTSSPELLASEQRVQTLMGGLETQSYLIVEGEDSQHVLRRTEQVLANLNSPVMAVNQLTPSLEQQQSDYGLISTKLYGPEGALSQLCKQLAKDCRPWLEKPRIFNPGLVPANLPTAFGDYFPPLAFGDDRHGLIFSYHNFDGATVANNIQAQPWLRAVDQVQDISDILASFRIEVSKLFIAFLALFGVMALGLYRARGLVILAYVLVSLLMALALSASAGITLFHILALLLVMGIAVDTMIFYLELGLNGDSWLAATLSMLTSTLAFGLLSLSQVPLLHHFGSVVFFGLLCSWLLAPVLYHAAIRQHTII